MDLNIDGLCLCEIGDKTKSCNVNFHILTADGLEKIIPSNITIICFENSESDAFFPKSVLNDDYNVPMQHNSNSLNDWDFTTIWSARDNNYPILAWQN